MKKEKKKKTFVPKWASCMQDFKWTTNQRMRKWCFKGIMWCGNVKQSGGEDEKKNLKNRICILKQIFGECSCSSLFDKRYQQYYVGFKALEATECDIFHIEA